MSDQPPRGHAPFPPPHQRVEPGWARPFRYLVRRERTSRTVVALIAAAILVAGGLVVAGLLGAFQSPLASRLAGTWVLYEATTPLVGGRVIFGEDGSFQSYDDMENRTGTVPVPLAGDFQVIGKDRIRIRILTPPERRNEREADVLITDRGLTIRFDGAPRGLAYVRP